MQRWCTKLRSLGGATLHSLPPKTTTHLPLSSTSSSPSSSHRLLHSSPNLLHRPLHSPVISPNFKPLFIAPPTLHTSLLAHSSLLPLSLLQVRHITAKQRKRKLKSRKPMTPVISKVKKVKMKSYSSFKGRFRTMNDGQIRRWKAGKRHNAHLKSKKAKRRLRQPGIVPLAYAKVMKKLNFCG